MRTLPHGHEEVQQGDEPRSPSLELPDSFAEPLEELLRSNLLERALSPQPSLSYLSALSSQSQLLLNRTSWLHGHFDASAGGGIEEEVESPPTHEARPARRDQPISGQQTRELASVSWQGTAAAELYEPQPAQSPSHWQDSNTAAGWVPLPPEYFEEPGSRFTERQHRQQCQPNSEWVPPQPVWPWQPPSRPASSQSQHSSRNATYVGDQGQFWSPWPQPSPQGTHTVVTEVEDLPYEGPGTRNQPLTSGRASTETFGQAEVVGDPPTQQQISRVQIPGAANFLTQDETRELAEFALAMLAQPETTSSDSPAGIPAESKRTPQLAHTAKAAAKQLETGVQTILGSDHRRAQPTEGGLMAELEDRNSRWMSELAAEQLQPSSLQPSQPYRQLTANSGQPGQILSGNLRNVQPQVLSPPNPEQPLASQSQTLPSHSQEDQEPYLAPPTPVAQEYTPEAYSFHLEKAEAALFDSLALAQPLSEQEARYKQLATIHVLRSTFCKPSGAPGPSVESQKKVLKLELKRRQQLRQHMAKAVHDLSVRICIIDDKERVVGQLLADLGEAANKVALKQKDAIPVICQIVENLNNVHTNAPPFRQRAAAGFVLTLQNLVPQPAWNQVTNTLSTRTVCEVFMEGKEAITFQQIAVRNNQPVSLHHLASLSRENLDQLYNEYMTAVRAALPVACGQDLEQAFVAQQAIARYLKESSLIRVCHVVGQPQNMGIFAKQEPASVPVEVLKRVVAVAAFTPAQIEAMWRCWSTCMAAMAQLKPAERQLQERLQEALLEATLPDGQRPKYRRLIDCVAKLKANLEAQARAVLRFNAHAAIACLQPLQVAKMHIESSPHFLRMHLLFLAGLVPKPTTS